MINWNLIGLTSIIGLTVAKVISAICECVIENQRFKYLMENKELLKNIADIKVISSDEFKEFENNASKCKSR